jgi:hypothetical protein
MSTQQIVLFVAVWKTQSEILLLAEAASVKTLKSKPMPIESHKNLNKLASMFSLLLCEKAPVKDSAV